MFPVCAFVILLLAVKGSPLLQDDTCNYVYSKDCHESTNVSSVNNFSVKDIKSCSDLQMPKDVNYTIILNDNNSSAEGIMKVEFPLPDAECIYRITLLQNPLASNEGQCESITHEENDLNEMEIHTIEQSICIVKSMNAINVQNTSILLPCQGKIVLQYRYIFAGCYVLRFRTYANKYITSQPKFLKTDYKREDIIQPLFHCTYDVIAEQSKSTDTAVFATSITVAQRIYGLQLDFSSVSELNKNKQKACVLYSQLPMYIWNINMVDNKFNGPNCTVLAENNTTNENGTKTVKCGFKVDVDEDAGYCFRIRFLDERCHKQTLWNPHLDAKLPCTWVQSCTMVPGSQRTVEYADLVPDRRITIGPSLLLPIIGISISVITILGFACFVHHMHKRHVGLSLREHIDSHARSETTKLDDFATSRAIDETDGEMCDNANRDIVLVYTKSSPTFVTFMATFREMLSKQCGCFVHDWYAANEWNNVAKVGPSEWFSELLRKGCRVVWIDTVMTRALVPSKLNNNVYIKSKFKRQGQYEVNIGDFRDSEFPVVLDLAKRNAMDSGFQYHVHFIVRLKGFEAAKESYDPFVDLSPYARYLIPQHFDQLCSHLSPSKSNTVAQDVKTAQNSLEQCLSTIRIDFTE